MMLKGNEVNGSIWKGTWGHHKQPATTEILLELGLGWYFGMLNPDNAVTGKYKG